MMADGPASLSSRRTPPSQDANAWSQRWTLFSAFVIYKTFFLYKHIHVPNGNKKCSTTLPHSLFLYYDNF